MRLLGCPHLRVSQRVIRYDLAEVLAWLESQKVPLNTSDAAPAEESANE